MSVNIPYMDPIGLGEPLTTRSNLTWRHVSLLRMVFSYHVISVTFLWHHLSSCILFWFGSRSTRVTNGCVAGKWPDNRDLRVLRDWYRSDNFWRSDDPRSLWEIPTWRKGSNSISGVILWHQPKPQEKGKLPSKFHKIPIDLHQVWFDPPKTMPTFNDHWQDLSKGQTHMGSDLDLETCRLDKSLMTFGIQFLPTCSMHGIFTDFYQ